MPTSPAELDLLANAAARAASLVASASPDDRIRWLEAIADVLDAESGDLVALAAEETHLGASRLHGEIARTTGQLRLFAHMIREGSYLEATIDHSDPAATPPRPDLRRLLVPSAPSPCTPHPTSRSHSASREGTRPRRSPSGAPSS